MRFSGPRALFKLLLDASLAALAMFLAFYVRLGWQALSYAEPVLVQAVAGCFALSLPVLILFRLNRSLWRYTSLADLIQVAKAGTLLLVLLYLWLFTSNRLAGIPRSLPVIHWLLQVACWGGPRALYRLWHHRQRYVRAATENVNKVPVLLVGANSRAELFIRETAERPLTPYRVVGILELNRELEGHALHGIPIYTRISHLKQIVEALAESRVRPQKIVVADDAVEGEALGRLLDNAESLGLPVARLPAQTELRSGADEPLRVRPIAIEDLLGRSQQVHDRAGMRAFIEGKCVLITGAGGSIGGELARQVASFKPAKLVLFELSEFHLYEIHRELKCAGVPVAGLLGDVRDAACLSAALASHNPSIVFHAAAVKHVPIAEENIEETILTNAVGTRQLAQACKRHNVEVMVLISTDKAVHPTNVMGAAKRLAEKICTKEAAEGQTRFVTVRFGNVLGSAGSVVPLFQEQLCRGGPLTVTHADMERYFMTIREAVELVIQAAALGHETGGVFVLDMGRPVKIVTLAEQMIRLAGFKPYNDIRIVFTGLRPGEKLTEELFYSDENPVVTAHAAIRRTQTPPAIDGAFDALMASLEKAARQRDASKTLKQLKALVPEYKEANA
jgi:O-antigen biosynthesis protein WbqV